MIPIAGVTLVLTRKCNAGCRHCGFSCGPGPADRIPLEQVKTLIADARKLRSLESISITGGEPFLFFSDLREIIGFARSLGLSSEVVTNSFWATSHDAALARLRELQHLGLRRFVTSLDEYHAEFVAPTRVRNAVRAAMDVGIAVTVKSVKTRDSLFTREWIEQFIPIRTADRNVKLVIMDPVPTGRAEAPEVRRMGFHGSPASFAGCCDKVVRYPAVGPDGDVYPCCSFGEPARRAGSVFDEPLSRILRRLQRNLLFNLLAVCGPAGVWELAAPLMPQRHDRQFSGACDLCNALYDDRVVRDAVERMLLTLSGRHDDSCDPSTPISENGTPSGADTAPLVHG